MGNLFSRPKPPPPAPPAVVENIVQQEAAVAAEEEETGRQGKAWFQCQTAYPDQRPRADSATSRRAGKKGKWFQPQSIPSFGPQ